MSIQAIVYALGLRDGPYRDSVTPAERLTIVSIANRVNPDYGNECFLPTSTIAAEVGVSERTLQRIFDALEGKGLLGRTPHVRDDGSQTTNTYSLPDFERGRWEMDDGGVVVRYTESPRDHDDDDVEEREVADAATARRRDINRRRGRVVGPPTAVSPPAAAAGDSGVTPPRQRRRPLNRKVSRKEVEPREEPNFGASAELLGDQVTVHAADQVPAPTSAVEDDFVPIEVERERERAERRAAWEERERVEAEQRAEMLREREQRKEADIRVAERYLEEYGLPPATSRWETALILSISEKTGREHIPWRYLEPVVEQWCAARGVGQEHQALHKHDHGCPAREGEAVAV